MHASTTDGWGELFLAEAGASAALAGLLAWSILVGIHMKAVRGRVGPSRPVLVAWIATAQLAILPFLVAGASLQAGGGLYWLVPGVVLCLVVAVLNAWVLLIEIQR